MRKKTFMTLLGPILLVSFSSCNIAPQESVTSEASLSSAESSLKESSSLTSSKSKESSSKAPATSAKADISHGNATLDKLQFLLADNQSSYTVGAINENIADEVIIPATYKGLPVTTLRREAFKNCKNITSLSLPKGLTTIGEYAVSSCTGLWTLYIPETVHTLEGDALGFAGSLEFEASIRSPFFSSKNGILYNKSKTEVVRVPCSTTQYSFPDTVESIAPYAFSHSAITEIEINWGMTSIGEHAFECTKLEKATIAASVDAIGDSAFEYCDKLREVDFNYDAGSDVTSRITSIGERAFYNTKIESFDMPSSVQTIGERAFCLCTELKNITLSDDLRVIGSYAFFIDRKLTSINIPKSVETIGVEAFESCDSLTSFKVDQNSPHFCSIDDVLYTKDKTKLVRCPELIGTVDFPAELTSFEESAFSGCVNLTSITIPDTVTSLSDYLFYECSSLTSVDLPINLTSIPRNCFAYSGLTSVTIHKRVETIGKAAFYYCSNLTTVDFEIGVSVIENSAFAHCSYLNSIEIPDSVTTIGDCAFSQCERLVSISLPESVTSIGDALFEKCTWLTSATLDAAITSIPDYLFNGCKRLSTIAFTGTYDQFANLPKGKFWNKDCPATMVNCITGNIILSLL